MAWSRHGHSKYLPWMGCSQTLQRRSLQYYQDPSDLQGASIHGRVLPLQGGIRIPSGSRARGSGPQGDLSLACGGDRFPACHPRPHRPAAGGVLARGGDRHPESVAREGRVRKLRQDKAPHHQDPVAPSEGALLWRIQKEQSGHADSRERGKGSPRPRASHALARGCYRDPEETSRRGVPRQVHADTPEGDSHSGLASQAALRGGVPNMQDRHGDSGECCSGRSRSRASSALARCSDLHRMRLAR
mmetsp:Transcript_11220/g.33213  ORF Transcript_11220/g.33213 Transcript_11220/m.33213 type:complete len:245 (+) Transcript_11220:915-1649(+)